MRTLSVFTLQGLGNSILAMPILLSLRLKFKLRLHLMNETASHFFSQLNLEPEIVLFKNTVDLFTQKLVSSDIAVCLYPNWRRELLALWRCKAGRKISFYDPDFRFSRLVKSEKIQREKIHDVENNFKILECLGYPVAFPEIASLLFPGIDSTGEQKRVILHPTASTHHKYYPLKFWVQTIRVLLEMKYQIELISGSSKTEEQFCLEILNAFPSSLKIGYFRGIPLYQVAKKIAASSLFIGLDSSLMHLSALLDRKTIALWSFADYRRIYPYGNSVQVVMPEEVVKAKNFSVPKERLPYFKRACEVDIRPVIEFQRREDFCIVSKFKPEVKFYVY